MPKGKQGTATYHGPDGFVTVDGVTLRLNVASAVGAKLLAELKKGSGRLEGHEFSFGEEIEKEDRAKAVADADSGGSGGSDGPAVGTTPPVLP